MQWSSSEGKLLYVAERKLTKTASYFDKKTKDSDEEGGKATEEVAKVFLGFVSRSDSAMWLLVLQPK
jgi:hypothetical protein